jgi:hypothetical protein
MRNPDEGYTRCRMHGGSAARANWKHGAYSTKARAEAKEYRILLRRANATIKELNNGQQSPNEKQSD